MSDKNSGTATLPAPTQPTAEQQEIAALKQQLREAEARLAQRDADRPAHLTARATGVYRVSLEGCRPRPATYTVRRRERLPRETIAELAKHGKTVHPVTYKGSDLGGEPCRSAWERFAKEAGIVAE